MQKNTSYLSRKSDAFTMVELLVVIGVIALLISILLPVMASARESANRARCAGNLRNWGASAARFAIDNEGRFPMCFRNLGPNAKQPRAMRRYGEGLAGDPANLDYYKTAVWKAPNVPYESWKEFCDVFGTSWQDFARYGMPTESLYCPTVVDSGGFASDGDGNWGATFFHHYMYVGGLSKRNVYNGMARWGTAVPAVKLTDADPARRILAADTVWWGSQAATGSAYGNGYEINHPSRGDATRPAFQNVVYADGHVEGHGASYFNRPLSETNYSLNHWQSPHENYLYWGLSESAPVTTSGVYQQY